MKFITLSAIALAAATAVPAAAQLGQVAPQAFATPPATGSAPGAAVREQPTRYCVISQHTGTRLSRKRCQTREQWMNEGFDPLARR